VKKESVSKLFLQKLPNFLIVTDLQTLLTIEFPCEIQVVSISYLSHGLDNWVFVIVNCVWLAARTGLCSWHQGNSALKFNIQGLILLKSPHFALDKVSGMHVGNTILVDHNLIRMLRSPIDNVMLVEKWNGRVYVF